MAKKKAKCSYQVIVGNIGTVYDGGSKKTAMKEFSSYVKASKTGSSLRAEGEDVVLMEKCEGHYEPIKEHYGHMRD